MNINEYVTDVLTVLKKGEKLKHLMESIADDSDLAPAKDTIQDIQERMVQERIIELTREYFDKAPVHVEGAKLAYKQGFFARRFGRKTK